MTHIVELVEADPLAARRGEHSYWHGNQAKRKVAFPDSRGHLNAPSLESTACGRSLILTACGRFPRFHRPAVPLSIMLGFPRLVPHFSGCKANSQQRLSKRQVCSLPRTQKRTWDRIRPWPSSTNISGSAASTERLNPLALPRKGPNPPAKILLSYKSTQPAVCTRTFAWQSMAR